MLEAWDELEDDDHVLLEVDDDHVLLEVDDHVLLEVDDPVLLEVDDNHVLLEVDDDPVLIWEFLVLVLQEADDLVMDEQLVCSVASRQARVLQLHRHYQLQVVQHEACDQGITCH